MSSHIQVVRAASFPRRLEERTRLRVDCISEQRVEQYKKTTLKAQMKAKTKWP